MDMEFKRPSGRAPEALRPIKITPNFTCYAEGSVLMEVGQTRVICTASVEDKVPIWLKDQGEGWITAEYGLLPRATGTRNDREAVKGRQSGRTQEIQRLIGRSLRAVVDLKKLGQRTIKIDCDVIQADGGTRCASITGAFVALKLAIDKLVKESVLPESPMIAQAAAISVGIYKGVPVCDLDYQEDSNSDVDMNIVMTSMDKFIEVQGTAEGNPFSQDELNTLIGLAKNAIHQLFQIQREVFE